MNALIFGSTGAIGSDLVLTLAKSNNWKKIYCVVRKQPQQWKKIQGAQKIIFQRHQNMDQYFQNSNDHYSQIHTLFCCLGSQVKHGQQTFRKIDKIYPLMAADIAIKNKIGHYLLFSSNGSNQNSWFLYLKVKGEVQRQMKQKKMKKLSIFKPGLLTDRRDARVGQKIFGICPCVPKIQASHSAQVLKIIAQKQYKNPNFDKSVQIYQNEDMLHIYDIYNEKRQ